MEEEQSIYETQSYRSYCGTSFGGMLFTPFDGFGYEEIRDLIRDPMANNQRLRELSHIAYNANGVLTNTIDYMVSMPTLDYVVVCHGKSGKAKKEYIDTTKQVLRDINHKQFVRGQLHEGFMDGVSFYYFEIKPRVYSRRRKRSALEVEYISEINSGNWNISLISLSPDWTRITHIKNNSYVLAFNLDYFNYIDDGVPIEDKLRLYPQEIRDAYESYKQNSTGGNWFELDNDKTIAIKLRAKRREPWGRPLALAALEDIFFSEYFQDTKRNILDGLNHQIVYETFPEGEKKGTSSLTDKQQLLQHNTVRDAVVNKNNRRGITFFSVAAGTKVDTVNPKNLELLDEKNEKNVRTDISTSLGFAASLLSGEGSGSYSAQQNNIELVSGQIFAIIEQISSELNKCINANIIKKDSYRVEVSYLPITYVNRETMEGFAKELYLQGKGSLTLWAASCGISPDVFYALLDEELENDIENKYPVHRSSYTQSKDDNEGGRPEGNSKNPNTIKSKANNSNSQPKPSTS